MATLLQDFRYGFRMLVRRPAFTAIAILALALGIGANTAVFSVIRGVLLRPLPYSDPDRLVMLWESNLKSNDPTEPASAPNFKDWKAQNTSFTAMAARSSRTSALTEGAAPEQITGAAATVDFLDVLGVSPALGRRFAPGDEEQALV